MRFLFCPFCHISPTYSHTDSLVISDSPYDIRYLGNRLEVIRNHLVGDARSRQAQRFFSSSLFYQGDLPIEDRPIKSRKIGITAITAGKIEPEKFRIST